MEYIDLNRFRQNAELNGVCKEYSVQWDNCISKKDLFDLACDVNGAGYLCDSIAKGWGVSPSYVSEKFNSYLNGRYTYDNGKYSSQIYCQYKGDIECTTTLVVLIDCDATIYIPKGRICEIYITGKSNISFKGQGKGVVVRFGDKVSTIVESENVGIKYVQGNGY